MRKFKKNTPIEVYWEDVVDYADWQPEEKATKLGLGQMRSIGYYLNQDDRVLRISWSMDTETGARSTEVIPIGLIKKVVAL